MISLDKLLECVVASVDPVGFELVSLAQDAERELAFLRARLEEAEGLLKPFAQEWAELGQRYRYRAKSGDYQAAFEYLAKIERPQ